MQASNTLVRLLGGVLLTGALSSHAFAVNRVVSDGKMPGDSNSKWLVGLTGGGIENPLVGDSSDVLEVANLNLEYRGETLFLAKDGLGLHLLRFGNFSSGMILSGKMGFLSDKHIIKDNEALTGVEQRNATEDLGMYLIHNSRYGQLRLRALEEISGEHDGRSADATYIFHLTANDWRINPYVSVAYESKDLVSHFYGVSAEEATTNRLVYDGKDSVNLSMGINARYDITQNWEVGLGASVLKLGEGISDSSLIDKDLLYTASISANYNF
mgnify:CR=1 FL=1